MASLRAGTKVNDKCSEAAQTRQVARCSSCCNSCISVAGAPPSRDFTSVSIPPGMRTTGDFTQGFVRMETPQRQLVPRCSSAPRVLGTLSLLLVPRPPYSAGFLRRHNSISTCIKIAKHVHRGRNWQGIQANTVAAKSSGACYGPACPLTQEA